MLKSWQKKEKRDMTERLISFVEAEMIELSGKTAPVDADTLAQLEVNSEKLKREFSALEDALQNEELGRRAHIQKGKK